MMLIDAELLIKHLSDWAYSETPTVDDSIIKKAVKEIVVDTINDCIKAVEEQPIAYDVGKVIEKLLERAERVEEFGGYDNGKLTILTRHVIPISIAVDVVKKG